ncbi:MAG: NrtA/SsuA/CpmA family ABC transporter substrate-binding protein [Anaerolineales bacterium]|nr:NrtA/SsuA/CpmA family ABC transporter substrate-binding protein [Anaerolineales bacterium]
MKKMSKSTMIIVLILLVVVSSVTVWLLIKPSQGGEIPMEQVVVATGKSAVLVYIAEDQGYFTENGLDVKIIDFPSGKQAVEAMLAGEADIATASMSVLVSYALDGRALKTFAEIAQYRIKDLVARRDRGITQISDLKGIRIGVTMGSAGEFALGRFLTLNGISSDDVELVDISAPEMVKAIDEGMIDAALTWEPYTYHIVQALAENTISWPGDSDQDSSFILLCTDGWLEAHPTVDERFLLALLQAETFVLENNQQAREFIEQQFAYDPAYWASVWPKYSFTVRLSQGLILAMEDEARWRIEAGLTEARSVPNFLDFISIEALEKVHSEAITMIR